jgi:hypothetical protein
MRRKFLELCGKRKREIRKVAISVVVVLGLACAMGDKPSRSYRDLDPDYTYLIGNGEPVFRIYSPRKKKTERLIAPTIEIID